MRCVLRGQFRWEHHPSTRTPSLLARFLAGGGRLFRILAVSEIKRAQGPGGWPKRAAARRLLKTR